MPELYIGLMSGTSVDGIDAGLVKFDNDKIELIAFECTPFQNSTKKLIREASLAEHPVSLKNYGILDTKLGNLFAEAANKLLEKAGLSASEIVAIGNHGQTVYHAPELNFSLQIGDANIIAEKTGITTIADFRRRDIAAGGQGAPLVPAFHQAIFSKVFDLSKQHISIVNIGGIANMTYLSANKTIGFDTGPGNTLMDYWVHKHLDTAYDKNGAWAKSGTANPDLIRNFKQDPYFKLSLPKSTGKEYFSPAWLSEKINQSPTYKPEDVQASLSHFTAETITDVIKQYAPLTEHTLICGGGMHNEYLIGLIQNKLDHPVTSTSEFGINPDHVEAMAFAWLARQTMHNLSGNLIEVTGARNPVILGGIYPGNQGLGN